MTKKGYQNTGLLFSKTNWAQKPGSTHVGACDVLVIVPLAAWATYLGGHVVNTKIVSVSPFVAFYYHK